MGCHFCQDELYAVLGILAGVRYLPGWVRGLWARRHQKPNCHHGHGHPRCPEEGWRAGKLWVCVKARDHEPPCEF